MPDMAIMPMCNGEGYRPTENMRNCTCERREAWTTKLKAAEEVAAAARLEAAEVRREFARMEEFLRFRFGRLPWDPPRPTTPKNVHEFVPKEPA